MLRCFGFILQSFHVHLYMYASVVQIMYVYSMCVLGLYFLYHKREISRIKMGHFSLGEG